MVDLVTFKQSILIGHTSPVVDLQCNKRSLISASSDKILIWKLKNKEISKEYLLSENLMELCLRGKRLLSLSTVSIVNYLSGF